MTKLVHLSLSRTCISSSTCFRFLPISLFSFPRFSICPSLGYFQYRPTFFLFPLFVAWFSLDKILLHLVNLYPSFTRVQLNPLDFVLFDLWSAFVSQRYDTKRRSVRSRIVSAVTRVSGIQRFDKIGKRVPLLCEYRSFLFFLPEGKSICALRDIRNNNPVGERECNFGQSTQYLDWNVSRFALEKIGHERRGVGAARRKMFRIRNINPSEILPHLWRVSRALSLFSSNDQQQDGSKNYRNNKNVSLSDQRDEIAWNMVRKIASFNTILEMYRQWEEYFIARTCFE